MDIIQTYARNSSVTSKSKSIHFDISQELSRKSGVSIYAMVNHSLDYARVMLALHRVVVGDWRTPKRDVKAYQEWVTNQYKVELPKYFGYTDQTQLEKYKELERINKRLEILKSELLPLEKMAKKSRKEYYNYLYHNDREKWVVLDPVISVHPDSVIFEAFSLDESSYGRVTVQKDNLNIIGDVIFGTTNIDFSKLLVNEFQRVRNYRPAWIKVEKEEVELSTDLGSAIEKKIDLPPSWIRGFLQVQSASVLPGTKLELSTETLSNVLSHLTRNREKKGPRSLRFILKRNKKPNIIIDPWGLEISEHNFLYNDNFEGEIRIWGRRRLMVLKNLLPFGDSISIHLMGTGMPSYWSLSLSGHRFDLGLSGWSSNDWSSKANFSILASSTPSEEIEMDSLVDYLSTRLVSSVNETSKKLKISKKAAVYGLQILCEKGQAMYDPIGKVYRWRQLVDQIIDGDKIVNTLFQFGSDGLREPINLESDEEKRMAYAGKLIRENRVKIIENKTNVDIMWYKVGVIGRDEKVFTPELFIDNDGRISKVSCTCSFYRLNKLKKGPCDHIAAGIFFINKNSNK